MTKKAGEFDRSIIIYYYIPYYIYEDYNLRSKTPQMFVIFLE